MKTWKKNLVAAAVLIMVCTGIYVNWLYTEQHTANDLTDTLDIEKVMSEDALILTGDETILTDAPINTAADYFAAVRLSRQQARDSAVNLLQDTSVNADQTKAAESAANLEDIVQTALTEAQIENLVVAKGYAECVAFIGEDSLSLAVAAPEEGLTDVDTARIVDVVGQVSNFTAGQIKIIAVE